MKILGVANPVANVRKTSNKVSQPAIAAKGRIPYSFYEPYDAAYREALDMKIDTWKDCIKIFEKLKAVALKQPNALKEKYIGIIKLPFEQLLAIAYACNFGTSYPLIQEPGKDLPLVLIKEGQLWFNRTNRRDNPDYSIRFYTRRPNAFFEKTNSILEPRIPCIARPYGAGLKHTEYWPDTLCKKEDYKTSVNEPGRLFFHVYYNKDGTENFWKNLLMS